MSAQQNKDIATKWFAGFNEQNLENILSLYADDAEHFSPKLKVRKPETHGSIKGKPALRAWWKDAFGRLPTLKYELKKLTADAEQVFMEYIRHVTGEEDMNVG